MKSITLSEALDSFQEQEISVFVFDGSIQDMAHEQALIAQLTVSEIERLKQRKNRTQFISSRVLIKQVAKHIFGGIENDHEVVFDSADNELYVYQSGTKLPFKLSLSHSKQWIALAFQRDCYVRSRFGLDIEKSNPKKDVLAIAKEYFSEADIKYIFSQPQSESSRFYQLWTAKEAFTKQQGTSLWQNLATSTELLYQQNELELNTLQTPELTMSLCTKKVNVGWYLIV